MATQTTNSTYMTPGTPPPGATSGNTTKPTLLAFHGSGSNATIHTVQLARLMRVIKPHFNIESLDAPFPSPAGPGILPFFDGCGPFHRWLPPSEKVTLDSMRTGDSTSALSPEVEALVRTTVQRIRAEGGRVVGLIGFSQGTKVVAGLLRGAEIRKVLGKQGGRDTEWCDFSFGVSVCGSYPPPLLPPSITAAVQASSLSGDEQTALLARKIAVPTFHVIGKADEWNWAGRGLIKGHFEVADGKSEVVEWDMGHHYPVKPEESEKIGKWMLEELGKVESVVVSS